MFASAFTLGGFRVETASSGVQGVAMARAADFDLLLIELRLPDMDAAEVIRAIRDQVLDVRFVFVSAFLTVPMAVEAMKLGAADVLHKPVTMAQLVTLVNALVDPQHAAASSASITLDPQDRTPLKKQRTHEMTMGSIAERWAMHVLKACESDLDLKTLKLWAECAGVSYSSLRESCDWVGFGRTTHGI